MDNPRNLRSVQVWRGRKAQVGGGRKKERGEWAFKRSKGSADYKAANWRERGGTRRVGRVRENM